MRERQIRRDDWGFGVPCVVGGCYEIGYDPDGKCDRHHQRDARVAALNLEREKGRAYAQGMRDAKASGAQRQSQALTSGSE